MAHILKEFAKHCGVKTGKPIINNQFFPICYDEYITIDTSNCSNDSEYFYFKEYVEAFNALKNRDIKVVNICGSHRIENADMLINSLSSKQCNYVIKNSKLHICVDSATGHIASHYKVPTIVLFSHSHPRLSMPLWNTKLTECITPKYKNDLPNYFPHSDNSIINSIYPDEIVEATNRITNYLNPSNFKTVFIGKYFKEKIANIIPDFHEHIPMLKDKVLNIRFDKCVNYDNLQKWLQTNHCGIVSNNMIDVRILNHYKRKIKMVIFESEDLSEFSEDYFNTLKEIGLKFKIYIKNADDKTFKLLKNDFFDFPLNRISEPLEFPFKFSEKYKFASNNIWFSKGKGYKSYYNAKILDNGLNIANDEDLIKEIENFYIYE